MASLFLKLLNMSIAASWLILAVVVLRVVLKRAPKWIHCILWALVAYAGLKVHPDRASWCIADGEMVHRHR